MQTTYRLKAHEISTTFLKSLKTLFAGQEVEIIVKSVTPEAKINNSALLQMVNDNRQAAPVISSDINVRGLIDDAHNREDVEN